jgi:hypothetical protein
MRRVPGPQCEFRRLRIRRRGAIVARNGMNARLVEASVLLGASALTVWLFLCAREFSVADVRRQVFEALDHGGGLSKVYGLAQQEPDAWIHDEEIRRLAFQRLARGEHSACQLVSLLPGDRAEIWEILATRITDPEAKDGERFYGQLLRMPQPVPETVVERLWDYFFLTPKQNVFAPWRAKYTLVAIEQDEAGKRVLLRKWQAASDEVRERVVAVGLTDSERRWQPATK